MLKKRIFYFSCFFSIQLGSPFLFSETSLQNIDQQIQALKQTLSDLEGLESQKEVRGQGEMIADWEAYRRDLQHIKQLDEKKLIIQQQLEQLEREKQAFLQKQPKSNF